MPETPLTDEYKHTIGKAFAALKSAIDAGDEAAITSNYDAFRVAYRGDAKQLVDQFSIAKNRQAWIVAVQAHLIHEIGSDFFHDDDVDDGREQTTGYQIVFLDEQGVELSREPDIYGREVTWIVLGEYGYTFLRQVEEEGQTVRYYQRGRLDD